MPKHLVAYDEPNLFPVWIKLDAKDNQIEELSPDGTSGVSGGSGSGSGAAPLLPTARQASLTAAGMAAAADDPSQGCGQCHHAYLNLEPLTCRDCSLVAHYCCISPPLEKRPSVLEATQWICPSCVRCVGCHEQRRAKPDVALQTVASGATHLLCKAC